MIALNMGCKTKTVALIYGIILQCITPK